MKVYVFLVFVLQSFVLSINSYAEIDRHELTMGSTSPVNSTCIGNLDQAAFSSLFEVQARKLAKAHHLKAEDVLARLIFSEGLSTGCLRDEECNTVAQFKVNIFIKIGWGIAKKFKSKNNQNNQAQLDVDIWETVFKKSQFPNSFRSKINGDRHNIFAEAFLCPEKIKNYLAEVNLNYIELLKAANEVALEVMKNPIIGDYRFVTHFYYPKSPFVKNTKPDWLKGAESSISNNWISMYHIKSDRLVESK